MYCRRCGKKLQEGAAYCGYCGLEIRYPAVGTPGPAFQGYSPGTLKKGKKTGSAARLLLVTVPLLLAAVFFALVFFFFHLKPGRELNAMAARWKQGKIGTVAGMPDVIASEDTHVFYSKEDEELYNKLVAEYGDMLFSDNPEDAFSEGSDTSEGTGTSDGSGSDTESRAETSGREKETFLQLVLEHSGISVKKPLLIKYPCDVVVTVDGPDMVKLLENLNYQSYEDGRLLLNQVAAALDKESFETMRSEIQVQIEKDEDGSLRLAAPSSELADALYGGALSLYAQEEAAFYESFFEQ